MDSDADRSEVRAVETGDGSSSDADETVRVWLVERTYSDDEQNIIILVYATLDGRRYFRKERALTSFTSDVRETTAAVEVPPNNLGEVTDEDERERYAAEATRMAETYDPDDAV
ncbi:MAG: hypothetical protein ABEJ26_01875 [Halosimplex sp.]